MGNERFVVVNVYNDVLKIHIRQYEVNPANGKSFPTRVGTCMTPTRFANFYSLLVPILDEVVKLRDGEDVDFMKHIGGGVYVTVKSGFECVNLRQYFLPPGNEKEVPTRQGIALRLPEWDRLLEHMDAIRMTSKEIEDAKQCFLSDDHMNIMGWINCRECNAFPQKDTTGHV